MTNYMKKTLLILFTAVLLGAPVSSYAFTEQGGIEQSVSNIKIEIKKKKKNNLYGEFQVNQPELRDYN